MRAAPAGDERRWSPRSPVAIGLSSVVLAVPLAVLGGATGPYDDPKAWALPILAAATALAWLATAPGGRALLPAAPDRARRALRAIVLGCAAWWVITTLTSVAPALSLFGNFGRGMGLLVTGAAVLLFFLAQSECRTPEAVRALVDAALLGSAPVCLLALAQAVGWDPLPRSWDPAITGLTVRSTFGQHIFLGSYLVVLIPVAGARLEAAWRRWRSAPRDGGTARVSPGVPVGAAWVAGAIAMVALASRWEIVWWGLVPWGVAGALAAAVARRPAAAEAPRALAVALLAALVAAQVLVLALSRARGPLLGLLLGASAAGFVWLARRRAWKAMGAGAAALVLLVSALVLLNVPGSPLAPLAKTRLLSRLGQLANAAPGTPVWFRLRVWDGVLAGWRDQLRGEEVISGTSPRTRSIVGYGLETELISLNPLALRSLDRMVTTRESWSAVYLVDRAHNMLLEQLIAGGLVGAGLWLALVAALLAVGLSRIRHCAGAEETSLCIGGFGAIVAHLAEGQVGIVTPMPLALFWITAAWLTLPPWSAAGTPPVRSAPRPSWWKAGVLAAALLTAAIAWSSTQWLLASTAYARGVVLGIARQPDEAYLAVERSRALMPWLPLPAAAAAHLALRLAATETDPARRARLLRDAEAALTDLRRHALPGAADWALVAQLAFAQARAGDRDKLGASLEAFATAARLSPGDAQLLAQWGWALLDAGDPAGARRMAERALALSPRRGDWLAWAVLARAARDLGDRAEERRAADKARRRAPPGAARTLDALIP